jgi:hypothetical protein
MMTAAYLDRDTVPAGLSGALFGAIEGIAQTDRYFLSFPFRILGSMLSLRMVESEWRPHPLAAVVFGAMGAKTGASTLPFVEALPYA